MRKVTIPLITCLLLTLHTLMAQINVPSLEAENVSDLNFLGSQDCKSVYCKPGVRNRSQSRGLVFRYERQGGFNWSMNNAQLEGTEQRVRFLEQLTFKFKVPVINQPSFKFLLGYEWDSEKYFFDNLDPIREGVPPTMWQLLNERRLKSTKLSAYASKSWDDKFYSTFRIRLSLNGDYDGLLDFGEDYRTYSAGAGFGKKVSEDEEWGVGITFSTNKARTVVIPFFLYNKTWNDRWGLESALPAQVFLRHNINGDIRNALLIGAKFDSRFYAINSLGDAGRYENLDRFFLRNNGIRTQIHYEHNLGSWFWLYAQGGMMIPVNARFNALSDVNRDLQTQMGARPFFRIGVFVAPPKELIR
ncbi:MAG: hypothetical protein AAF828_08640 [Bacteroidota bacterium]